MIFLSFLVLGAGIILAIVLAGVFMMNEKK